jgi:hypothetical protein
MASLIDRVDTPPDEYQQQLRRVMGLRVHAFQDTSPGHLRDALPRLAAEEERLQQFLAQSPATEANLPASIPERNHMLGAATTQLQVEVDVCMHPLPTAIYHLLNPETDPLLRVSIKNLSPDRRRVRVRAAIEGLSAESVKTIELSRTGTSGSDALVNLLPTLLPGTLADLSEVQRASVYVITEDLDRNIESHDTYAVVCLSRNSSFNAVRNPSTGALVDFSHYYGAWVTPYDELVQERIRAAAGLCDPPQIWGYQGEAQDVTRQVRALFQSLQQHGMKYVNSVIDYGAPDGYYTQRTRLPRESLRSKSANCIDGAVLMASLLEGGSLNAALVLVPGHAFVAWETWEASNTWQFLETTVMGEGRFEDACRSGQEQYDRFVEASKALVKLHALRDLRRQGIWPMA